MKKTFILTILLMALSSMAYAYKMNGSGACSRCSCNYFTAQASGFQNMCTCGHWQSQHTR